MRVSIIGAGQAGMILAHYLLREGIEVDVYTDRSADQWLNESRPTGTAYLFANTIDIEQELGIDAWSHNQHDGQGMHIHVASPDGERPLVVAGRSRRPGAAVDQRLKFYHWIKEFEARGGQLHLESVTAERLGEITQAADLTILAAGKGEIGKLIPRDPERSVYAAPQRQLAMVVVRNVRGWAHEVGFAGVKFSALGPLGDLFWVPFTHKTAGKTWSAIIEARKGGPLDVFQTCQSGEEVVDRLRTVLKDHVPWDYECTADMEYIHEDAYGWLVGAFPPTVRQGYGIAPSGRPVMPVGDTAITFDPIGGQGGNNATHHAKFVAKAILDRAGKPFDQDWMKQVFDDYWAYRGSYAYRFNNMFLEPPTAALQTLLMAASQDQALADTLFVENIGNPRNFFPWIEDLDATRAVIGRFGSSAA